jgi:hypothetical protein
MKKVTLQEQINRSLKMMGLINEAASGRGNFIAVILGKLAKNEKDVFFTAIEKKIGEVLPQKGLNAVLSSINNNKITRKEVLNILINVFKQAGKDVGLFSNFIKEGAPTFFADLQKLIKGNVSRADIKGVLPELEDLPEEIFEDLLIKAGFKEATEEAIEGMVRSMSSLFPFLFKEKGWWFFKDLLNEEEINAAIERLSKEFAGKNDEGMRDIIQKKLNDIEVNIKASNLQPEDVPRAKKMLDWMKKNFNPLVYKKVNGQSVVSARQSIRSVLGKSALVGGVVGGGIVVTIFIDLISSWYKNNTGSGWKDLLLAFDQQFGGTSDVITRKTYKEGSMKDLLQYLTDTFGNDDWVNKYKITTDAKGIIEIKDSQNVSKYFVYDKQNRTYFESDSAGEPKK